VATGVTRRVTGSRWGCPGKDLSVGCRGAMYIALSMPPEPAHPVIVPYAVLP
jgi:hypothetical protein